MEAYNGRAMGSRLVLYKSMNKENGKDRATRTEHHKENEVAYCSFCKLCRHRKVHHFAKPRLESHENNFEIRVCFFSGKRSEEQANLAQGLAKQLGPHIWSGLKEMTYMRSL